MNYLLVTNNEREFKRVEGLRIENGRRCLRGGLDTALS